MHSHALVVQLMHGNGKAFMAFRVALLVVVWCMAMHGVREDRNALALERVGPEAR